MVRHNIVLVATECWEDSAWRRRHHVAWVLSKHHHVLFIEPPYPVVASLRDGSISWKRLLALGRLKHRGRNLYSYSPAKLLPESFRLAAFGFEALNRKMALSGVKRAAARLGLRNPILWVYFSPHQYDYYGLLAEQIVVGDIYDKFGAPSWKGMPVAESRVLERKQEILLQHSHLVFTVSKELRDELIQAHCRVHLIPNGVDFDSFQLPTSEQSLGAIEEVKGPVLGFLGMLHYKVDFELLDYLAEGHPEWTILLMGKDNIHSVDDRSVFSILASRRNVIWCGELDRREIPGFLARVDVCLVPLKKLAMNKYSNFLKVWEYLAAGKPIVAVDQGGKSEYPDLIRFAESREAFAEAVDKALRMDTGRAFVERRKKIAKDNSWGNRVVKMLEIIADLLAEDAAADSRSNESD
ncbi:glycosyltransferase [Elusimicrobiota bacterium]